jgi:hypothetical protein
MAQRDEQDFLLRNLPTTQYHARFEPTLVPENDPEETFVNTPVLPGCPIIKVYLTDLHPRHRVTHGSIQPHHPGNRAPRNRRVSTHTRGGKGHSIKYA